MKNRIDTHWLGRGLTLLTTVCLLFPTVSFAEDDCYTELKPFGRAGDIVKSGYSGKTKKGKFLGTEETDPRINQMGCHLAPYKLDFYEFKDKPTQFRQARRFFGVGYDGETCSTSHDKCVEDINPIREKIRRKSKKTVECPKDHFITAVRVCTNNKKRDKGYRIKGVELRCAKMGFKKNCKYNHKIGDTTTVKFERANCKTWHDWKACPSDKPWAVSFDYYFHDKKAGFTALQLQCSALKRIKNDYLVKCKGQAMKDCVCQML